MPLGSPLPPPRAVEKTHPTPYFCEIKYSFPRNYIYFFTRSFKSSASSGVTVAVW